MIGKAALALASLAYAIGSGTAHALDCTKSTDSVYCRDGKMREVFKEADQLVWADTRLAITRGQFSYLVMNGPIDTEYCVCLDLYAMCVAGEF
jgi:hypothetical protein